MSEDDSEQLVAFVSSIPPPVLRPIREGRREPLGYPVFEQIGCTACHSPQLGQVNGLYSDLLLHDMGANSADAATYYGAPTTPRGTDDLADSRERRATGAPALPSERRTPPLWGVADTAPYLHDGRAPTLDDAIRTHDGEAKASATRYAKLPRGDRRLVLQFLHSLTSAASDRKGVAISAIPAHGRRPDGAGGENGSAGVEIPASVSNN